MLNTNKIKKLMDKYGEHRDYFIRELGISQAKFYIRLREANFEAKHIVKLAELFEVSVAYLFDEENLYKIPKNDIGQVNDGAINYKIKSDNQKLEIESLKKEIDYLKKINVLLEKENTELKRK